MSGGQTEAKIIESLEIVESTLMCLSRDKIDEVELSSLAQKYASALNSIGSSVAGELQYLSRYTAGGGDGASAGTTSQNSLRSEFYDKNLFDFQYKHLQSEFYKKYESGKPNGEKNGGDWCVFDYPKCRRDDTIVDDYHGTKIPDPYRFLEDADSKETGEFVQQQVAHFNRWMSDKCPQRKQIRDRLEKLWNYSKFGCPKKRGDFYYYSHNSGLQNQHVVYRLADWRSGVIGETFIDPNSLSADGTIALTGGSYSKNGAYYAYALSDGGSDWKTIQFKRTNTEVAEHSEVLKKVKFSSIAWTHDNAGIFYCRYDITDDEGAKGTATGLNLNQRLYYHVLGNEQSKDILCAEFVDNPKWMMSAEVSDCGRYVGMGISEGCEPKNRLYICDLKQIGYKIESKLEFDKIIDEFIGSFECITNDGAKFMIQTNYQAGRSRLISIDLANPQKSNWVELIPEHETDTLQWTASVRQGDLLVTCYSSDVKDVIQIRRSGSPQEVLHLLLDPAALGPCSVTGFAARREDDEMFFSISSFLTPGVIFRVDLHDESFPREIFRETKLDGFDFREYEARQVFYEAKEGGTRIPMFIVHRRGLSGPAPTLLYGYGGFSISITPSFSVSRLLLLKHLNGVLAVANIRGGGEYGEEKWHRTAILSNKQRGFDDFQRAAEYLIAEGISEARRLAIVGGSNGGLLVAACVNQRPDLFALGVSQVGVLDMLRFHRFTIGHAWTSDYGCADEKEQFDWLIKYSPLHSHPTRENIGDEVHYPMLLLVTADHDDRVVPSHSLKYAAQLQHSFHCDSKHGPILMRVDTRAGHGAGRPTKKIIDEAADIYAVLAYALQAKWHDLED